jgi:hypothetical protein
MKASIEDQLLHSSLLCGLSSSNAFAYRLQIFFVANRDLGSRSHQSDFQRALETGVDAKGLWANHGARGSGEYSLTPAGLSIASERFSNAQPKYPPFSKPQFRATLQGSVGDTRVRIVTIGEKANVSVDGLPTKSAVEACKRISARTGLSLDPTGTSAVRVLYDLGIDNEFQIEFT